MARSLSQATPSSPPETITTLSGVVGLAIATGIIRAKSNDGSRSWSLRSSPTCSARSSSVL